MASTRMQHKVPGLLGILWLLSILTITGGLQMSTMPKYLPTCGQELTLICSVTAEDDLDIESFIWMEKKDICGWNEEANETGAECNSIKSDNSINQTVYDFILTIHNIQPKHKGTYHCKLRAKEGVANNKTIVRVQKCVGKSDTNETSTRLTCTFKDVFPKPSVAWTRGQENITNLARTEVTENTEGLFTAVSSIERDPSNTVKHMCSLLMPIESVTNETAVMEVQSLSFSGGYRVIACWFGITLAMVLGILIV